MRPAGERIRNRALILLIAALIVLLQILLLLNDVNFPILLAAIALPIVLVLPGYALMTAAFSSSQVGTAERVAFGLGISLTIAVLGGLFLHWASDGIEAVTWVGLLGTITIVFSLAALTKRREARAFAEHRHLPRMPQVAILVLASFVAITAIIFARFGASQYQTQFTQLWMLSDNNSTQATIQIGMRNFEGEAKVFSLYLEAADEIIHEWPSIKLEEGESWQASITLPAERTNAGRVEAKLFQIGDPEEVYRQAVLWINQEEE